ncbi:hypothetical protein BGX27_006663 [Mortierella sp. AM989]|nr:hypothetical protein BGX27_006663 [Mortierella sp. AM989]
MKAEAQEFEPSSEKQFAYSTDDQTLNSQDVLSTEKQLNILAGDNSLQPQALVGADTDQEKEDFDSNSEEVRKVRWKVDKRLVPLLSLLYLCSFLDRSNIGNAKVANLEEDLNLESGAYNAALSIFFVGYILGEIPANIALKKLGPRIWVPIVMFCWGTVSICMAAVSNGTGLIVTRFLLGLAESGFAPGPVYIISLWYRRCEHALRVAVFFSAATVAGAFGGLLAYGISQLDGVGGLHAWQWIFIIEGLPTIICAAVAYFLLPDFPETSTFLTPEEKALTIKRLKIDVGPATDTKFSWLQVWAVFKDWKIYFYMIIGFLHAISLMSLSLFVPSITLGFGFDHVTTQIMTAPIYVIACICTILMGFSSDRFQERGYHGSLAVGLAAIGYLLLVMTRESSTAARYISLIICTCGVYSFTPVFLSWPSSNIGGHTKRGVAIAAIISFAQIGGVIAGQLYRNDDAPHYVRANAICAGLLTLDVLIILAFKILLRRENKRRDQLSAEEREKEITESDNTDSNPDFRFFE